MHGLAAHTLAICNRLVFAGCRCRPSLDGCGLSLCYCVCWWCSNLWLPLSSQACFYFRSPLFHFALPRLLSLPLSLFPLSLAVCLAGCLRIPVFLISSLPEGSHKLQMCATNTVSALAVARRCHGRRGKRKRSFSCAHNSVRSSQPPKGPQGTQIVSACRTISVASGAPEPNQRASPSQGATLRLPARILSVSAMARTKRLSSTAGPGISCD